MAAREIHPAIKIWIPVVILLVASMVIALQFAEEPPPKKVVFATGGTAGAYYAFGEQYQKLFKKEAPGIDFQVVSTGGSLDNLKKLQSGEADVAFIQGGVAGAADPNGKKIEALCSVYYEPFWVFYRAEKEMRFISELKGKRVAVGGPTSGTYPVAREILKLNGITEGNAEFHASNLDDTRKALLEGNIDAALFISSPKAAVIRELLNAAAKGAAGEDGPRPIRVLSFRRHEAYGRNLPFLKDVLIPEGLFDMERNIPPQEIVLLSATATLCARADLHPAVARLFAKFATELHGGPGLLEEAGEFPSLGQVEFPLNNAAEDYFVNGPSWASRALPFWAAAWVNRLKILLLPLLTLFIPLMKFAPVMYRVGMQKRIYRWYKMLNRLEARLADKNQTKEQLNEALAELDALAADVTKISVPLGYRKEVYNLRMHIGFVTDQIGRRKAEQAPAGNISKALAAAPAEALAEKN